MVKIRPRVAVVDDDESVRKALQRLLCASDFDAETFGSAKDFLASLPHVPLPDCLVLDLHIPGISGLDLQRQLVRIGPQVPTVVITGHDEPGIQERGRVRIAASCWRPGMSLAALEVPIHRVP
jgi:FixJ family two-component response regulator